MIICFYRYQYTLGAATSVATKMNEENLAYLNQGQSYELKLRRFGREGEKGKILKVSLPFLWYTSLIICHKS